MRKVQPFGAVVKRLFIAAFAFVVIFDLLAFFSLIALVLFNLWHGSVPQTDVQREFEEDLTGSWFIVGLVPAFVLTLGVSAWWDFGGMKKQFRKEG